MAPSTMSQTDSRRPFIPQTLPQPLSSKYDFSILLLASISLGILWNALPKVFSPVYGSVAVSLYRPAVPLVLAGSLLALRPLHRTSWRPTTVLALTACFWAVFLSFADEYLARDVYYIGKLFNAWSFVLGPWTSSSPSEQSLMMPVIASSIVESLFFVPLTLSTVSMVRQTARKTGTPPVIILSLMGALGAVTASASGSCVTSSYLYWMIALMLVLCLASVNSFTSLLLTCTLTGIALLAFTRTTTYDCGAIPRLLNCRISDSGFKVLESLDSITGRITVLENSKYRLMKADHSLLGGEWLGDASGQSVFSTFYMQSLAIYCFDQNDTNLDILQIGLGIGTATRTILDSHKFNDGQLSVDVVELDPAVIKFAHEYFNLPRPESDNRIRTHAINALDFVESSEKAKYGLISHDIFTGGEVAYALLTSEFFHSLRSILKVGGVLTVNFVWAPASNQESFESATNTLRSHFKFVLVYVEHGKVDIINNVLFVCSDAPIYLAIPDSGREPTSVLGMTARNMKHWEYVKLSELPFDEKQVLRNRDVDGGKSYKRVQAGAEHMALKHWQFMRKLLPEDETGIWQHL